MFGIGSTELIIIALVLLIFVGPKQMPIMLRKISNMAAELRNAGRDLRNQIEVEMKDVESPGKLINEMKDNISNNIKDNILKDLDSPYNEIAESTAAIKGELKEPPRSEEKDKL